MIKLLVEVLIVISNHQERLIAFIYSIWKISIRKKIVQLIKVNGLKILMKSYRIWINWSPRFLIWMIWKYIYRNMIWGNMRNLSIGLIALNSRIKDWLISIQDWNRVSSNSSKLFNDAQIKRNSRWYWWNKFTISIILT